MRNSGHTQKKLLAQIVNSEVAAALENFSQSGDEGALTKSASVVAGVFDSDHVFAHLTEKASAPLHRPWIWGRKKRTGCITCGMYLKSST